MTILSVIGSVVLYILVLVGMVCFALFFAFGMYMHDVPQEPMQKGDLKRHFKSFVRILTSNMPEN